jgi:GTP pyrophosphokinase
VETIQLCPPAVREAIARVRAAVEAVSPGATAALSQGAEAAEVMGALTEDVELAKAVLIRPLLGREGLAHGVPPGLAHGSSGLEAEVLASLTGRDASEIALALQRLGELGLPRDWSPARGLDARQAEILRKMLLAVVSDPRLVLARLAEHLVSLRHARETSPEERERRAVEARAIFAPLANRLGVWQLKWELEDLAFRYLEPGEYRRIAAELNERRADRERYIESLCETLRAELAKAGVHAAVYGRPKHMYSIYRKMARKHLAFEQLFDVRAVRVVVDTIPDCYAALGVVHGLWPYIQGEFDDYVATPKDNFYRSIHTAVMGPESKSVEVQIRTREMHEHAELGVAAHWTYKEGGARDAQYQRKIEWVRRLLEPHESVDADFVDQVRTELFEDRVYAITPKGEVVDLPRGSTPLDFAYSVHTSLGHRCRGAKVNGRIVPLTYTLSNGEIVEIIAGKQEAPSRDWMAPEHGYLVSARNRSKVRAWFRDRDAGEIAVTQLAQDAAKSPGRPMGQPGSQIMEPPTRRHAPVARPTPASTRRGSSPVEIEGVGDLPVMLARCCAPLRPQPIVGYVTVGRGVTVHRSNCPSLLRMRVTKPERVLHVEWAATNGSSPSVELSVSAYDRSGLVRDITDVLAFERLSIEAMTTTTDRGAGTAHVLVTVAIGDLEQLARVLKRLTAVSNVIHARRLR